MAAGLIAEAADRTGHTLPHPATTTARFFLAGVDGLTTQRLAMPDEEAEYACLQALVSASVTLAGGRPHLVAVDRELATGTRSDT